jgi:HlyD family secretion protein
MEPAGSGVPVSGGIPTVRPPAMPPPNAPTPRAVIDYDFETLLSVPPRRRLVLWLLIGLIAATAGAMAVARVDIVVVANGHIETSDSEMVIQPLETSVVRSVAVKMGDTVRKGEVLATLDPTFTEADQAELQAKLRNLEATHDRLAVELAGREYALPNPNPDELTQLDIFNKRRDEYVSRLDAADRKVRQFEADLAAHKTEAAGLQQQVALFSQANDIYRELAQVNLVSKLRAIESSEQLIEAKSRLETNLGAQQKLVEQIGETNAERDAFVHEWNRKLAEEMARTRSDRDATAAQLSKAKLRRALSVMTAPRDANVLELADRPAGSVVQPAEPLIRLVPADAPLVADLQVDTRDVARLHPGDAVTLKFEALPWQQFGLAYGRLKTLTPDALPDVSPHDTSENMSAPDIRIQARESRIHYIARVVITGTHFRNLPTDFALRPGMRLVGEIKIGHRSPLEYIINPITRVISESLREP